MGHWSDDKKQESLASSESVLAHSWTYLKHTSFNSETRMVERKHISKIGRKPRHKRQMIYYSFQQKYLRKSAGPQVLFWQSIQEDKRVGAERHAGMRSLGVFGSRWSE